MCGDRKTKGHGCSKYAQSDQRNRTENMHFDRFQQIDRENDDSNGNKESVITCFIALII